MILANKKNTVDFYHYRVDVYKHSQHTFMFNQHIKVRFASNDPFNKLNLCKVLPFILLFISRLKYILSHKHF